MKKAFKFDSKQLDYTIKAKKSSRLWWLLLLLLLPLLLLIRFEKTIYVKTVDANSKQAVANADVSFSYHKAFAYDKGRFFTDDLVSSRKATDSGGKAEFVKLSYSLYSYIFQHNSVATVFATNNCYSSDTLALKFHQLSNNETVVLELKPAMMAMDFKVVDRDDKEPIPGASVGVTAEVSGVTITDTATTGADGRVVFSRLPKCGTVKRVYAIADGYYPDSLVNQTSENLLSGPIDAKRLLSLRPIRKPIEFYVVDCKTKTGLADVDVTIDFQYENNKKPESVHVKTNINGVGKGVYDSAKLIAKLHLSGRKAYYKKGELPGWHKVKEFTDTTIYKRPQRTFCLEPEPNPLIFRDIDSLTRKPIAGVKNYITIVAADGKKSTEEATSGANGEFQVSINPGDKISIKATYPPGYKDNDYTIKDADADKLRSAPLDQRTIPLSPVIVTLVFRTVDKENGSLIPDADLAITGDGVIDPRPVKSGNGEFTVKATLMSTISIVASKPGYGSNSEKINNKSVQYLMKSDQPVRDIPLKKDPPKPDPPPPPCSEPPQEAEKGTLVFQKSYDMANPNVNFDVVYDMHQKYPDRMIIYCGKDDTGPVLGRTSGAVLNTGRLNISMKNCSSTWITIKVIPANDDNTEWEFHFECK